VGSSVAADELSSLDSAGASSSSSSYSTSVTCSSVAADAFSSNFLSGISQIRANYYIFFYFYLKIL